MKFTTLALLGLVAVGTIQIEEPTQDDDMFLLAEDDEELVEQDEMIAEEDDMLAVEDEELVDRSI